MYKYKYTNHLYFCLLFYRTYLCHCADFLGAAEEITTKGVPDLLEGDKNSHSEQYPTLARPTFSVYYKTVFTELITCVKGIQPGKQREDREVRGCSVRGECQKDGVLLVIHSLLGKMYTLSYCQWGLYNFSWLISIHGNGRGVFVQVFCLHFIYIFNECLFNVFLPFAFEWMSVWCELHCTWISRAVVVSFRSLFKFYFFSLRQDLSFISFS